MKPLLRRDFVDSYLNFSALKVNASCASLQYFPLKDEMRLRLHSEQLLKHVCHSEVMITFEARSQDKITFFAVLMQLQSLHHLRDHELR